MIRMEDEYVNSVAASSDYPGGSFKNESGVGVGDGTPNDKTWANNFLGFMEALLDKAGITASGAPETASASDCYDALEEIFATVASLISHINDAGAHLATSEVAASRIVIRDSSGRFKASAPSVSADVAIKATVDAEASSRSAADTSHANLTSPHGATSSLVQNRIMMRDVNNRCEIGSPSSGNHIANKTYADGLITTIKSLMTGVMSASGYFKLPGASGDVALQIQWFTGAGRTVAGSYSDVWPQAAQWAVGPYFVLVGTQCAAVAEGDAMYQLVSFNSAQVNHYLRDLNGLSSGVAMYPTIIGIGR